MNKNKEEEKKQEEIGNKTRWTRQKKTGDVTFEKKKKKDYPHKKS